MKRMMMSLVLIVSATLAALGGCVFAGDADPPAGDTPRLELTEDPDRPTVRDGFDDAGRWETFVGSWTTRGAAAGSVLVQTATDRSYPLTLLRDSTFEDVDVTVRFRPVSGRIDASGGIVFRAKDAKNFYVVRANSLEDNFRLYTVIDGSRSKIASTRVDPPALGKWHTLRVVAVGDRIQAYLDGKLLIDHRNDRFGSGRVGLWTKADAVTEFDDFTVTGTD